MSSDGYLTYSFLLRPGRFRGRRVAVHIDSENYKLEDADVKLDALKGHTKESLSKMFYKISKERIANNFKETMNMSERRNPPHMVYAPGFSHIHTDYWKVIKKVKLDRRDGIFLSFNLQNAQPDFKYSIIVYPSDRGHKSYDSLMSMYGNAMGPKATGTVMYTGVVGNLTARMLTKREGEPMEHQGLWHSSLGIQFEIMKSDGTYGWSESRGRTARKFIHWYNGKWVWNEELKIHGSKEYRNAITHNIKQAVVDEIGSVKNGLPVEVKIYK